MNMFGFLKRLFKDKETEETVEQDKLLFWFDNKVKERLENFDNDVKILFEGVENRKEIIRQRIEVLEKAEVKDPDKIENRIKNIVLGHRDNYIRSLNIFLNAIIIPEEKTLSEATKFNKLLKEKLDEFGKATVKSYGASQHLFSNEIQQVVNGLKDLNDLSKNFDLVVEKNKLNEIEIVKIMIDLLYKKTKEKEKLKENLELQQGKLNVLKENKNKKVDEVAALEKGDDYQTYIGLKEKKENIESQIRENQSRFLQIFAQLERALRKYEHVALENLDLIRDYLENPINAFFKDADLIFLKILDGVKRNLETGLGLKESKMEKTLEIIDLVTEEKLKDIKANHNHLMEEKSIISKKIDNSRVYGKLSDLKYRLEHLDVQIADLEQEIKELEDYFSKIDLEKIREGIKEKVFDVFRVRLSVV